MGKTKGISCIRVRQKLQRFHCRRGSGALRRPVSHKSRLGALELMGCMSTYRPSRDTLQQQLQRPY